MDDAANNSISKRRFSLGALHADDRNASWLPCGTLTDLGRVTVILGANGTGKSRLLKTLASQPLIDGARRPLVYVEGGRALELPEATTEPRPRDERLYESYRAQEPLKDRLSKLINVVAWTQRKRLTSQLAELKAWQEAGQNSANRPYFDLTDPLVRLTDSFSRIFPQIAIEAPVIGKWVCTKGNHSYGLNSLSDGEKQVFCLLGDLIILAPPEPLVVIDEPELNLHPSLAVQLWNEIEANLPEAVFVYATHSLSFAMRPSVEDVLILGAENRTPMQLTSPFDWPPEEMAPFLGAIPAVLTSQRILVTEGTDGSFDRPFYDWIN